MSLKTTIENNPVIVFCTAIAIGFSAYPGLLAILDRTTISKTNLQAPQLAPQNLTPRIASNGIDRYDYAEGFFARTNDGWIEQKNGQVLPFAKWKEEYIYLADPGRKMILRLPIKGGVATWASESSPNAWNQLTTVQPR